MLELLKALRLQLRAVASPEKWGAEVQPNGIAKRVTDDVRNPRQ